MMIVRHEPYEDRQMIFGADIPFAEHCGVEEVDFVDGRTRLRLALKPEHSNHLGIAHGGLLCTLLDIAMGTVARCTLGQPVMTLDMQTSFLAPGRGVLLAEGRILRAGRSILFCEAEIRTEAGDLVAKSSGVFKATKMREGSVAADG
jgi:uncharacterized protein (TIGR00369 family)